MNESRKTIIYVAAAVVLAILAYLATPRRITPGAFSDQGSAFFPDFKDPNEALTLEVISYDEVTGSASPFKVTFKDGRWTIPSHHDYPADARERLAKTAAGVIDIMRGDFRSDNVSEYAKFGVIDPLDQSVTGLTGRGTRITLKGAGDKLLADFIVGKPVEGSAGYRFVRVPSEKRVYATKINVDLSARFEDWIDKDLLKVNAGQISRLVMRNYSIDGRTGRINPGDNIILESRNDKWSFKGGQAVDSAKMHKLLTSISGLRIVGVRPKPKGLAQMLSGTGQAMITQQEFASLQSKGFYISREGQLMANDGEMQIVTSYGVVYTLRFGEIAYGSGDALTAGTGEDQASKSGPAANRYLFATVGFDPSATAEPPVPRDSSWRSKPDSAMTEADRANKKAYSEHYQWMRNAESGRDQADVLNKRFADWYYVIPSSSFEALHLKRADLMPSSGGGK